MKKFTFLGVILLLSALLLSSCSEKSVVSVFDGETTWPTIPYARVSSGTDSNGDVQLWAPHFQTEIGNSLRGVSFLIFTCEPGTYSGVYNAATEQWSTPVISYITLNVDYDGVPYPTWRGQSAKLTIHSYNKKTKRINATLEALMRMEGSTDTRNLIIDMQNMSVVGQ